MEKTGNVTDIVCMPSPAVPTDTRAHGDQAVLKSAGVLAHDDQRAVLQAVRAAGTGYLHLGQDPGEDPMSAGDLIEDRKSVV